MYCMYMWNDSELGRYLHTSTVHTCTCSCSDWLDEIRLTLIAPERVYSKYVVGVTMYMLYIQCTVGMYLRTYTVFGLVVLIGCCIQQ